MIPPSDQVAALIRDVAHREILPRFKTLGAEAIHAKSHANDLVTDADLAAEKALTAGLLALLPDSRVVGEESAYDDPAQLDRLRDNGWIWIVDPVDGTSNFVHGRPTFAVAVALVRDGQTVAGWLYAPIADEMVYAGLGQGSWCNGQRLTVTGAGRPLSDLAGNAGYRVPAALQGRIGEQRRHGSAAHDYMAIATGRMDFAVFRRLMPWDHAAGVLICQEAGAFVALLDGRPYAPSIREGIILTAPGAVVWRQMADALKT
ncbi:inositol monophosphatase family protein [Novispirillum itersonii]|uniref:inositol monophosphatase family protein n=1 Tax=Novispirillum itersonii TaxID=189 RepID=UPI00036A3EBF|nr:inositol monophosphatase [Novispirillum itersonii]